MSSSLQELVGLNRVLDRLQARIKPYRELLADMALGNVVVIDAADHGVSKGEVETVEALVRRFATRVTGAEPADVEWEPMHSYCSRNEASKSTWPEQSCEYFHWALFWVQKTRMYLTYLSGLQVAEGEPRGLDPAPSSPLNDAPTYDVALSFAGEDRAHAQRIAELLRDKGCTVFYDEYERATLWGRNLYTHLSDLYQNKARYCLIFVSKHYARQLWTKHERESAQARAFRESCEYILPLRLDDTRIPGIENTVGYVDLNSTTHEEVVQLLIEKLSQQQ